MHLNKLSNLKFCGFSSSTITKHWEAELAALKGNNAKLTTALLESTANVKQWKQQLAAYQEEAERLHKRVSNIKPTYSATSQSSVYLYFVFILVCISLKTQCAETQISQWIQ